MRGAVRGDGREIGFVIASSEALREYERMRSAKGAIARAWSLQWGEGIRRMMRTTMNE